MLWDFEERLDNPSYKASYVEMMKLTKRRTEVEVA